MPTLPQKSYHPLIQTWNIFRPSPLIFIHQFPIKITLHIRRIKRLPIILRQRQPLKQPPNQIRITCIQPSKRHQIHSPYHISSAFLPLNSIKHIYLQQSLPVPQQHHSHPRPQPGSSPTVFEKSISSISPSPPDHERDLSSPFRWKTHPRY